MREAHITPHNDCECPTWRLGQWAQLISHSCQKAHNLSFHLQCVLDDNDMTNSTAGQVTGVVPVHDRLRLSLSKMGGKKERGKFSVWHSIDIVVRETTQSEFFRGMGKEISCTLRNEISQHLFKVISINRGKPKSCCLPECKFTVLPPCPLT